ncbi:CD209 antigen-like protein E isoform X2 [Gadus chalcogrammus]|uniref:CD209 antigen-like protein E isoform X2 n=1 Tax=Gadus chalcogrammus TaxID=1042646 RepID=UPI0024C4C4FF|nr:CD209 antigen-like protein E isoform X2 [Gadus chalcogrammus]
MGSCPSNLSNPPVHVPAKERDQLQGRFSTLTKERDQLQGRFSTLTKERDQLQDSSSKLKKEVKTLSDTVESRKCPPGWIKFQCSCYKGHTGEKNWEDSRQYCKSQQADLVIINSREEQIFVNSLLPADTDNWIGLSDKWIEGVWTWVDGTSPNTTYWGRNQPNSHGGNQDCVEFLHRAAKKTWNGGGWNDLDCKVLSGCICEK